jgi:hypothetical protein
LSAEIEKISNLSDRKNTDTEKLLKQKLSVITCECGTDILLLPDLKAMNRAINVHVKEHRKKGRPAKKNVKTSSNISELLSQRLLIKITEQKDI